MQRIDELLEEYNLVNKKADILGAAVSSIGMLKEAMNEEEISIGSSKFGGLPDLPVHLSFPEYQDRFLSFLAQVNLKEAKAFDVNNLLPETGILYFFYDVVEQPWGFDREDKGCYTVLYYDGDFAELKRTPYPDETEEYFPLPSFKMCFNEFYTLPEEPNGENWCEEELDNYYDFRGDFMQLGVDEEEETNPMHYMLGEPFNIQNNVFEEILYYENLERRSNKLCDINMSVNDMVLLFQMDSDDDLDVMWGDVGILYFCINKEDLFNKQFDKVKFTLQCS